MDPIEERPLPLGSAALFYLALTGVAFLWGALRGDPNIYRYDRPTVGPLAGATVGIGAGLAVVVLSRWLSRRFAWARRLDRRFHVLLGPLSPARILALAVLSSIGEEAFFRGAMQPTLGLVATSLIFGLLHTGPSKAYLPWTIMAIGAGFGLGGLAIWSGTLLAPILAHFVVNGLNLWRLTR